MPVVAKNSVRIDFTCTDSSVFIFSAQPGLAVPHGFFQQPASTRYAANAFQNLLIAARSTAKRGVQKDCVAQDC